MQSLFHTQTHHKCLTKGVAVEEAAARVKAEAAKKIEDECTEGLAKALPILEKAIQGFFLEEGG